MDDLAPLAQRLVAALQGNGTDADRLLLLHAVANALAFIATLLIPLAMLHFAVRRRDFPFRSLLGLFAMAFCAAAVGHGLTLWGLWRPDQWLLAAVQIATALLLLGAALALWLQLPEAVRLPSTRQLRRANADLTRETWEQQRALQEAQDESALLRSLVAQSGLATAVLTAAGRWLHVNEPFAETLGLARADLLSRDPRTLLAAPLLDTAHDTGEEELAVERRGETRRQRWRATSVRDAAGKVRARLVQCRDVTAEWRAAEELAQARREAAARDEEHRREAAVGAAQLAEALAAREQGDAELAARAQQLERSAAQLELLGARLGELAGSDGATGLLSSHALAGRLELALATAKRFGRGFSVLVITIDPADELESHSAPLLAALGAVLRAELRDTDAAARTDQERVCVLLQETAVDGAARVAERVRRRLAATPLTSQGRTLRLACCVGAAEWTSGEGLGEVLGRAAEHLRKARAGGRNRMGAGLARD